MISKLYSATILGVSSSLILVETDVSQRGFPSYSIVGLPHKSIEEAKDRIRTAITNSGYEMPECRITTNLAPADLPKVGTGFDLPMALGILIGNNVIKNVDYSHMLVMGELSLDGKVKGVKGILSGLKAASEQGIKEAYIPLQNVNEAMAIPHISIYPVSTLRELVTHFQKKEIIKAVSVLPQKLPLSLETAFDFIYGQDHVKRALEIAAAGFHNIHLSGSPGTGKTAMARAFPSLLLPLSEEERVEVCTIYSASGYSTDEVLSYKRPYRAPHHTVSRIGLIGGGNPPKAGEITLAHRGVLFLDEVPEFPRSVLESLRQAVEDGFVHISRAGTSMTFPSRFQLLTASNPCPCGYLGHTEKQCTCSLYQIESYQNRMSGPFLDRIDLFVEVSSVKSEELLLNRQQEKKNYRSSIQKAAEIQRSRYKEKPYKTNAELPVNEMKSLLKLQTQAEDLIQMASKKLQLSTREYFRILRVARTIADLDCSGDINVRHLSESLQYRKISLDK